MRILIVENYHVSHLGQVGVALDEAGAEITICRAWENEVLPATPDEYDGLVVLGGEQSALDDHTHAYLPELARLMHAFGAQDKAVLGICLGSQMLARAYGAENLLGTAPEFGWQKVRTTAAAKSDPVLGQIGAEFPIFEWHSDTFTLPEGAIRLAENDKVANQCFRIGRASYGMQFHFEASRAVVEKWKHGSPQLIEDLEPGWLEKYEHHAALNGPAADATGLAIARAWVGLV